MTAHDPFSYGQVPMNKQTDSNANADDMLFADAGPASQGKSPAVESSWAELEAEASSARVGMVAAESGVTEFGADILGIGGAQAAAAPVRARQSAVGVADAPAPSRPPRPASFGPAPVDQQAAPAAPPAPVRRITTPSREVPVMPVRRTPRAAGTVAAIAVLAIGGAATAWFNIAGNPVMAWILGVTTVVAAALARVSLR